MQKGILCHFILVFLHTLYKKYRDLEVNIGNCSYLFHISKNIEKSNVGIQAYFFQNKDIFLKKEQ